MKTKTTGKFKVGDKVKIICECEYCYNNDLINQVALIHKIENHGYTLFYINREIPGFEKYDLKHDNSAVIKQKLGVK